MSFIHTKINITLKSVRLPVLITMLLTLLSCANPTIRTTSDDMDISLIAGKWKGEFNSQSSGNSGTITFDLSRGEDSASGQVFMKETLGAVAGRLPLETKFSRPLPIEFVHIGSNMVNGKVSPYEDLKNHDTIHTNFKGKISGDVMQGVYSSTIEETKETYTGNWKVTRQK